MAPDDDIPDLLPSAGGATGATVTPKQAQASAPEPPGGESSKSVPQMISSLPEGEDSSHLSLLELEAGNAASDSSGDEANSDPPDPLEFDLVSARGSQFPSHLPIPSAALKPQQSEASPMELNFEASPTSRKSSLPGPTPLAQNAAMELDFSRTSSAPPEGRSAPPPANSPKSLAPSATVPSTLGDNFNLGDDLDDLEFGATGAQFHVAVDTSDQERDVRWPTGRTPFTDEIAPDLIRARELSGFGPAPRSVFFTPIYTVHVHRTLKTIHEQTQRAQRELKQKEARRDEALCILAEQKRPLLQQNPRFAPLYSNISEHEVQLKNRAHELESSDEEGAIALGSMGQKIEDLNTLRLKKQDLRNKAQVKTDAAKKEVERYSAALKQIDIRYRNLQNRLEREAPGKSIPDEFEAQFQIFDDERQSVRTRLESAKTLERSLRMAQKEADKIFGRAAAAHQAEEGKKEAFLISQESTTRSKSDAMGQAARSKRDELAEAARVILELKGEVPVDAETRKKILHLDEGVRAAFIHNQNMMMAGSSMDSDAYSTGRAILIATAVGLIALLLWSAF